ncbi:hypothetical protein E2P84_21100 [Burkholderia cepacia]|uniref:Uncharacterized protein n=1 Tax=Burkholderia cepacia TaxID=292 RepID=A0AAX2RCY4_BURCE|nr:hypothetical protein E2P84_21100 [Burkholderia cepacia]TET00800.1 hypothetical protein E3D36_19555 [Burkholderia cepacia]TEU33845.1 hypothetical protein E3D37_40170 [Burkholderia cepacia]TEU45695.1 hypothetical protein E3D39_08850 [Burkholderia cepacia]TEU51746.1 hypothetical protein E3D38_15910 [Burkholderia cepacia]
MTRCAGGPCRSRDLRDQTLCDQRLRSRMLRISTCLPTKIVDKPARGRARRGAGHRAAFEAARTKPFGSSAWSRYAQAIHTLANTICGQAGSPARKAARHVARRRASGTLPAACRI